MEEFSTVFVTDYMEAQIIKGKLESEGIPVLLTYESTVFIYGFTTDGLGKVEVKVPKERKEEAKKIIEESESVLENEEIP